MGRTRERIRNKNELESLIEEYKAKLSAHKEL